MVDDWVLLAAVLILVLTYLTKSPIPVVGGLGTILLLTSEPSSTTKGGPCGHQPVHVPSVSSEVAAQVPPVLPEGTYLEPIEEEEEWASEEEEDWASEEEGASLFGRPELPQPPQMFQEQAAKRGGQSVKKTWWKRNRRNILNLVALGGACAIPYAQSSMNQTVAEHHAKTMEVFKKAQEGKEMWESEKTFAKAFPGEKNPYTPWFKADKTPNLPEDQFDRMKGMSYPSEKPEGWAEWLFPDN